MAASKNSLDLKLEHMLTPKITSSTHGRCNVVVKSTSGSLLAKRNSTKRVKGKGLVLGLKVTQPRCFMLHVLTLSILLLKKGIESTLL